MLSGQIARALDAVGIKHQLLRQLHVPLALELAQNHRPQLQLRTEPITSQLLALKSSVVP